ncbi:MAG: ATP-binding protein [Betaproteobacteria bacterium]
MTSIRQRLLIWLLLGLSAATVLGAWSVYVRARAEARELFDYQMQLMAGSFPDEGFGSASRGSDDPGSGDVVVVQIWDRTGARLYLSRPGARPPQRTEIGFSDIRTPAGDWRVYGALVGNNVIQISQPMRVREELAAGMALRTMLPLVILLPILIGIIWVTIGRGLKPVNDVAAAVAARSADALDPLPDRDLPREVRPLVAALNGLLQRLGRSLDVQREFVADAAHELRTPLTALRLQIQLAERAPNDAERAAAFERLKGGTERATRLVEQLLALARSDPEAAERKLVIVDLAAIARDTVAEQAPIAQAKRVDLGVSSAEQVSVHGDPESLRVLLGNLVDNALRYTPADGTVDVSVAAAANGGAALSVADDGPGIPLEDRERVFDRFYRRASNDATGSGLGLAIVRQIAQRHGATVILDDGMRGRGLKVTVRFPMAPRATS